MNVLVDLQVTLALLIILAVVRQPALPRVASRGRSRHEVGMALYTLIVTGLNGHEHRNVVDFTSDEALLEATREALTEEHRSIAIARGTGEDLEFLGAWDRDDTGKPRWTPDE